MRCRVDCRLIGIFDIIFYNDYCVIVVCGPRIMWGLFFFLLAYRSYLLFTSGRVTPSDLGWCNKSCCGYISCAYGGTGLRLSFLSSEFLRVMLRYCCALASVALPDPRGSGREADALLGCGHADGRW